MLSRKTERGVLTIRHLNGKGRTTTFKAYDAYDSVLYVRNGMQANRAACRLRLYNIPVEVHTFGIAMKKGRPFK